MDRYLFYNKHASFYDNKLYTEQQDPLIEFIQIISWTSENLIDQIFMTFVKHLA